MRFQISRSILFFVSAGVVLATLLLGLILLIFRASSNNQPLSQITVTPKSKIIMRENAFQGTSDWKIPVSKAASIQIQAYASATSVSPGETLNFYVSTRKEATTYSIDIYRLGWYGGKGGRLMASRSKQISFAQGYYDTHNHTLVGCSSCRIDTQTGLIEANWLPSYTLIVPPDWVTGVYLAKFTENTEGRQTYVPFDVRGNLHSLYVAVTSDTTYAAYNYWGGYSLYKAENNLGPISLGRGVKVSFDRPYVDNYGSSQVLTFEADAIHWLERQSYDLSYISSVDLHKDTEQLMQHRSYLSLGHDEYWTKEMRDGVERARDHGVGLAFLGANAAYWQIRFEPNSAGVPDRTIVCYKVNNGDLSRDPLYRKDNTRVTAQWRDPVLARPENALIGIMYSSYEDKQRGFPWQLSPQAKSQLLDGTSLHPGQQYGCGLVGYEWDRIYANSTTPAGIQVLARSSTVTYLNKPDISNTTYYIASSGAMVFATGSISWAASLDSYRLFADKLCNSLDTVVPGMQMLMAHVMDALVINHPSQQLTLT
jgi:hypothetical protein